MRYVSQLARFKRKYDWEQTSAVMAMLCNVNVSKKENLVDFDSFNPYSEDKKSKVTPESGKQGFKMLKEVFTGSKGKRTVHNVRR